MPDFTVQHNHALRFIESFPSSVEGKRVVDVGGGDGFMALHFVNSGAESVILVEPMIGVVLREVENHPRIVQTSSVDTVVAQHDIVWCHHVLEHVEAPVDFLRSIKQILKPDGWLWLAVPNMADCTAFSAGHINNFMAPQLVHTLSCAGFSVRDCSVWADRGQLRVRVQPAKDMAQQRYPEPMHSSMRESGRCPSEVLAKWNW